jgi:hypothetical protein
MKVAIVSGDDVVGDDTGQLCAALQGLGHEVTGYVRQRDRRCAAKRADKAKTVDKRYRIVSMCVGPGAAPPVRDVLPFVGDWAAALERLWSSDQPDIVHAYGWLGGLAAQLAARRHRLPTVQTFRDLAALSCSHAGSGQHKHDERERIEPLLARSATWVTVESTADVDTMARLRRSRARLSVLSGGIDVDRYTPVGPAGTRTDLYRVLCLAPNPLVSNGFDIAIRALPRVPGAEVVVAETAASEPSHDVARAELKRLAAGLGVADRVRFTGTVADDELPTLLRSADVVACTPREPPRATTVLQAMASGVAVVALPVGVLVDAVVHAVTGLVVSPDHPDELVAALRRLQTQRFLRESMGASGRSRARSRFTWERIALDAQTIYGSPVLCRSRNAAEGRTGS